MPTYKVYDIAADGEDFPVPGTLLGSYEADSALAALDAYSDEEGFASYSATEMLDEVTHWADDIASAPFTNYEIMAATDAAMVREGLVSFTRDNLTR